MGAVKRRLVGDAERPATMKEVSVVRWGKRDLNDAVANLMLENRISDDIRRQIIELAHGQPERSPRARSPLSTSVASSSQRPKFEGFRGSAASSTSPAFIVLKAADKFLDRTTAPNLVSLSGFC